MRRKRIDLDSKSEGSPLGEKALQVQSKLNLGQEAKVDDDENKIASSDKADDEADQGHRYGNFRNYYTFHPPSNRIQRLGEILDYVVENRKPEKLAKRPKTGDADSSVVKDDSFLYCDVGCNEGDLTMEVSSAIQSRLADDISMNTTGVDLDGTLIERANIKVKDSKSGIKADFLKADVCALDQLDGSIPDGLDLLSLFSTTMWLHIHAGDDGFRDIIKKLCAKTRGFFLIEPQPSKCYRNAMVRLRKKGVPEFDISSDRLKFRLRIEDEIDEIMSECNFQRVKETERTEWNRSLRLYERKE